MISMFLVTELRSMAAAILTATTAAERGSWQEAQRSVSDISSRAQRVVHQLECTIDSKEMARGVGADDDTGTNHA